MLRPRLVVLTLAACVGCARGDDTPTPDSVPEAPPVATPVARVARGSWATELGDLFVVPSDSGTALVVYPDEPTAQMIASGRVTLLGASGDTALRAASLTLDDTLQCGDAPIAHVTAPVGWTIGLRGGTAAAIRMDSIESLSAKDSAAAVVELTKLASVVTDKSRSRFTGLPFTVVGARRFDIGPVRVLAAHVVRRLPQEAAPLEEHTLLIAERRDTAWVVTFSQQSQGSEETAQYFDVVGAARTKSVTLLFLARDATSRMEYQILERSASGTWRVRWTRPIGC